MKPMGKVFKEIPESPEFPKLEEELLAYWKKVQLYDKIQEKHKNDPLYIFLEGPPTANGMPHMGHALTRAIKDVFLRYKTMKGHLVSPRIAGWDCHGLPVEIEVEKELGINTKHEIEQYGVDKFNQKCRESVFRYVKEWVKMSERIAFHLDMEHPYVTMENYYIESVWWSLKQAFEKELLFKGHKILPYCPRCGTPLSSHEVSLGYQEVEDPSIYVKFQSKKNPKRFFVAWTTTPWTLLSNQLLAVKADADYAIISYNGEEWVLAKELIPRLLKDPKKYKILKVVKGKDLAGEEYKPLFEFTKVFKGKSHRVAVADFVTLDEGTGIVHCAPAHGAEDYDLCMSLGLPLYKNVREDGTFDPSIPQFGGKFIKDADKEILEELKKRGNLIKQETIVHSYPFCWRCDTPLMYYALESWFIGMSRLRDRLVELNKTVKWKPTHLRDGRFGKFLEDAKDWALSRNRYWGTPLPVWICKNNHQTCVGSIDELEQLSGTKLDRNTLDLHKPYIDEIEVKCPQCGEPAKREPYVIDTWYDSGSASFAQWHYPFENKEKFKQHFPVDFITEAIDQTRGWFYTLLAVATVVFDNIAYKSVLSMGHVLDENGKKMSKSRGNVVSPMEMMDQYGADAVRWLLYSSPTWSNIRFGPKLLRETIQEFLLPLWNIYYFFHTYAELDEYDPRNAKFQLSSEDERLLMDKWLLGRLNNVIRTVEHHMESLEVHRAANAIKSFLLNDVSNFWIRLSRRRFWERELNVDKKSAYDTFYKLLVTLTKLLAPFIPYMSEFIYQDLVGSLQQEKSDEVLSVHLEDFPTPDPTYDDENLQKEIGLVRDVIVALRSARSAANLKIRQPLREAIIITNDENKKILSKYEELIKTELNVKAVVFKDDPTEFQKVVIEPQFKIIGPKFKKDAPKVGNYLKSMPPMEALALSNELKNKKKAVIEIDGDKFEITPEDVEIHSESVEGYMAATFEAGTAIINTQLTPELINEGVARDVIRRIQTMRKDLNLDYEDKIKIGIKAPKPYDDVISQFSDLILYETVGDDLTVNSFPDGAKAKKWEITTAKGEKITVEIAIKPK